MKNVYPDLYYKVVPKNDIVDNYINKEIEYVVFKEDKDIGCTRTIFYSIRNSLAHGNFEVQSKKGTKFYYFETNKNGEIRSKMRLSEGLLIEWIHLFKNFP